MRRAAISLSKLADTSREELPSTMAAVRLSGMEISDLTLELSDLSQEIADGVNKFAQAVQAAEAGVRQIAITMLFIQLIQRHDFYSSNKSKLVRQQQPLYFQGRDSLGILSKQLMELTIELKQLEGEDLEGLGLNELMKLEKSVEEGMSCLLKTKNERLMDEMKKLKKRNLASRSLVDDVLKKVNKLKPIADELGVPLSQLAIAWCASNPNVSSVITGATKEAQGSTKLRQIPVVIMSSENILTRVANLMTLSIMIINVGILLTSWTW